MELRFNASPKQTDFRGQTLGGHTRDVVADVTIHVPELIPEESDAVLRGSVERPDEIRSPRSAAARIDPAPREPRLIAQAVRGHAFQAHPQFGR